MDNKWKKWMIARSDVLLNWENWISYRCLDVSSTLVEGLKLPKEHPELVR